MWRRMFIFILVLQAIVAAALVTVILMQRSEGGGLGMGGSPGGLMSARGAADFLTRSTKILAIVFVTLSIVLAVMAATRGADTIDTSLARQPGQAAPIAPAAPLGGPAPGTAPGQGPLSGAARTAVQPTPAPTATPGQR